MTNILDGVNDSSEIFKHLPFVNPYPLNLKEGIENQNPDAPPSSPTSSPPPSSSTPPPPPPSNDGTDNSGGMFGSSDSQDNGQGDPDLKNNPLSKALKWFTTKQGKTITTVTIVMNLIFFVVSIACIIFFAPAFGSTLIPLGITLALSMLTNFIIFIVALFQMGKFAGVL